MSNEIEFRCPSYMSDAAWEIFKRAPDKWKEEVEAGRLIIRRDGSLSTLLEERVRRHDANWIWDE